MSNRVTRMKQYRPELPYPWITLKSTLEEMGWDVRILIIHRPLYDYLPSVYTEIYKYGPNKIKLRKWFGGDTSSSDGTAAAAVAAAAVCPSQGGRIVPRPFDIATQEITIARLLDPHLKLYPTPAQVYELFQNHGFTILLVDMMEQIKVETSATATASAAATTSIIYDGKGGYFNFIEHIVCHQLPGTVHTCKALLDTANTSNNDPMNTSNNTEQQQQQQLQAAHRNPSLSLHYDFIAVEACQKGLFNGTILERRVVNLAIQNYQEQVLGLSPNDFPLVCPSDGILQDILDKSLDQERRLACSSYYNNNNNNNNNSNSSSSSSSSNIITMSGSSGSSCSWDYSDEESRHKEMFWKAARDKKKFCTVNSKLVVQDEKWIQFFSTI